MDPRLVLQIIVLSLSAATGLRPPPVYEDVDESPVIQYGDSLAAPSEPLHRRVLYFGAAQQDKLRWKYFHQQRADAVNHARSKMLPKGKLPKAALRKREAPQDIYLVAQKAQAINFGLDHGENLRLLEESFGPSQERDIQALNALLGQGPNAQLEGLRHLLGVKDHTPITEHVEDIANPQRQPNVRVEYAPPEHQEADAQKRLRQQNLLAIAQMENELHAAEHAQAQEAIAKAQQAAEVEAQRHQLLLAQAQQEQTAPQQTHPESLYGQVSHVPPYQPPTIPHEQGNSNVYGEEKGNLQYASQYAFGYKVKDYHSGNNFGHEEVHDGKTAKGHYHVLLPDGRLQNVEYWADETGFHAKVTYDRHAQHPIH